MSDNAAAPVAEAAASAAESQVTPTQQEAPAQQSAAVQETAPAPAAQQSQQQAAAPAEQQKEGETFDGFFDKEPEQKNEAVEKAEQLVPDKYEFFSGEGELPPSEHEVARYSSIAKELGLTQEKAQKFFDISRRELSSSLDMYAHQWAAATANDSEIGGGRLEQTKANVSRFLKEFATDEFRELMKTTRLGNNPEMLRVLSRAGARLSQDNTFINGNSQVSQKRDPYAYMTNSPELK